MIDKLEQVMMGWLKRGVVRLLVALLHPIVLRDAERRRLGRMLQTILTELPPDDAVALLAATLPPHLMANRAYFALWENKGYHVQRIHYYELTPDTRQLPETLWQLTDMQDSSLDFQPSAQLKLLEVLTAFRAEYEAFSAGESTPPATYRTDNTAFHPVDAAVLHGLVRYFKPRRVIEIGSGNSTYVTAHALGLNAADGQAGTLTAVEPFPNSVIAAGIPGLTELIQAPVQHVSLATFAALQAGDILFIDSSHVFSIGSDVVYEMTRILPILNPGVIVHFHDVFLPEEYPRNWVKEGYIFWNEQYALQAFLLFNSAFEILLGSRYLLRHQLVAMRAAFGVYVPDDLDRKPPPASFWLRRR